MASHVSFALCGRAPHAIDLRRFRSLPRQMRARSVWALESAVAFRIGTVIKQAAFHGADRLDRPGPQASLGATSDGCLRSLALDEAL